MTITYFKGLIMVPGTPFASLSLIILFWIEEWNDDYYKMKMEYRSGRGSRLTYQSNDRLSIRRVNSKLKSIVDNTPFYYFFIN